MKKKAQGRSKVWNNALLISILALCTLFSIGLNGYYYGENAQSVVLVFQHGFIDDSLFQKDLMPSMQPYYYTYLYHLLAFPSKIFGIQSTYFIMHLVCLFFFFLAVFLIAKLLFRNDIVAYLAVFLLLLNKPSIAADTIYQSFFPRVFVLPLLMFAFYFYLRKQYILSFSLVGISMNFHMISSSHVFLLLMIAFLFDMKKGILETFLKVVRYGGVTLLTALPIFIWNFAHPGIGFSPSLLWWELIELRFLHHLAPFSWDIFKWIRAGAFVLVFLLALRLPPDKVYHAQIMRFVYGMLFLAAVATFFYYVVPLSILITLTFWRIAQFFTIFAMMYAANLIFQAYRKDLFFRIAAIGLGISLFLSNFKATLLFSLLLVALEHRKRPLISRCLLLAFILGMILATAGSFYVHIPYAYFFKIGTVPAILLLTLPLGAMVYEMLKGRLRNWQKASIQAAFLLFIVLFTIAGHILIKNSQSSRTVGSAYENLMEGYEYELKKTPPVTTLQDLVAKPRITATGVWVRPITIESLGNLATHPGKYMRIHIDFPGHLWIDDWRAVQFWAKDNTNRDAIFLVPPYLTDFRALSERAIVSDWDDMAMVNFHEEMGLVLLERFETVCNTKMIGHCVESQCLVRCRQSFNELGANQLKEIALRYQASYIIVEKPRILPLPLVFSNEGFSVYRVN